MVDEGKAVSGKSDFEIKVDQIVNRPSGLESIFIWHVALINNLSITRYTETKFALV